MKLDQQYIDSIHRLDAIAGLAMLPDDSIPLTVTSPPYDGLRIFGGHPWDFDVFRSIADQLWRVTAPSGVVAWVVADQILEGSYSGTTFRQALYFTGLGFRLHDILIMRRCGSRWPGKARYGSALEFGLIFSQGAPATVNLIRDRPNKHAGMLRKFVRRERDGRLREAGESKPVHLVGVRGPIWEYPAGANQTTNDMYAFDHPALMPEAMASDLIRSWSRPGDIVLDPMCGAGTACKMALLNDRRYLGFEVHEPYQRLAMRRLEDARSQYQRQIDAWLIGA